VGSHDVHFVPAFPLPALMKPERPTSHQNRSRADGGVCRLDRKARGARSRYICLAQLQCDGDSGQSPIPYWDEHCRGERTMTS
jgi:hypothetical protein